VKINKIFKLFVLSFALGSLFSPGDLFCGNTFSSASSKETNKRKLEQEGPKEQGPSKRPKVTPQEKDYLQCDEIINFDDFEKPQKFETVSEWSNSCFSNLKEQISKVNESPFVQLLKPQTIISTIEKFNEILDEQLSKKAAWFTDHGTNSTKVTNNNKTKGFTQREMIKSNSKSDVVVIGDIHGKIHSLLRILENLKSRKFLQDDFTISNPDNYIIFLGDYADRGIYGVEVWYTIMRLKIANPDNVILLRGNHERYKLAYNLGFLKEIIQKYGQQLVEENVNTNTGLFMSIVKLFYKLPHALYLGRYNNNNADFILFCHGGFELGFNPKTLLDTDLEKEGRKFQKIKSLYFNEEDFCSKVGTEEFGWKNEELLKNGFLWTDFSGEKEGILENIERGTGLYKISPDLVEKILQYYNGKIGKVHKVFRAHQHFTPPISIFCGENESKLEEKINLYQSNNNVFTFTAAPIPPERTGEGFGILHIDGRFENWTLEPVSTTPTNLDILAQAAYIRKLIFS